MKKIYRKGIYTFKKPKGRMANFNAPHLFSLHAKDGPAVRIFFFFKGKPKILNESWWFNGKLHREDDYAEKHPHLNIWWLNGKRHRLGGPAVEYMDGHKEWWLNGERHRVDGPAIYNNSINFFRFYLNNVHYNEQDWFDALNEEQKLDYLFKKGGKY